MDPAKIERPITLVYARKDTQGHTVNKVNVIIQIFHVVVVNIQEYFPEKP